MANFSASWVRVSIMIPRNYKLRESSTVEISSENSYFKKALLKFSGVKKYILENPINKKVTVSPKTKKLGYSFLIKNFIC